jgi:hypothetical protein
VHYEHLEKLRRPIVLIEKQTPINFTKQATVTAGYNSQVHCTAENTTLILRFSKKRRQLEAWQIKQLQCKYTDTSIPEHRSISLQ